jgi:hypothetical protein
LDFDERERARRRIAEAVVGFGRDVDVLAFIELQLAVAANDVGGSPNNDPVLAAPRVALKTQTRAGLNFKPFDFVTGALFQDLVAPPRPFICFSSHSAIASPVFDFDFRITARLKILVFGEHNEETGRDTRKRNGGLR